MKIFLGGTCNDSTWRERLIPMLKINYFNPIVDDWNEKAYKEELRQRKLCDYLLYVITPATTGLYSIAEVIDDVNKHPKKTIFCFLGNDSHKRFTKGQTMSLEKVAVMVKKNGGKVCKNLEEIANYVNRGVKTASEIVAVLIEKEAAEKSEADIQKDQARATLGLATGGAGLVGAGVAGRKISDAGLLDGRIKRYHSTRKSNIPSILDKGIIGSAANAADTYTKENFRAGGLDTSGDKLNDLIYLARNKQTASAVGKTRDVFNATKAVYEQNPSPFFNPALYQQEISSEYRKNKDKSKTLKASIPFSAYQKMNFAENPETLGAKTVKEYVKKRSETSAAPVDKALLKRNFKNITKGTDVIKGDLAPEYLKKSKQYVKNSLPEIGSYIKNNPKRFALGVGAGLGTAALGIGSAYAIKKSLDKSREAKESLDNSAKAASEAITGLIKKEAAMTVPSAEEIKKEHIDDPKTLKDKAKAEMLAKIAGEVNEKDKPKKKYHDAKELGTVFGLGTAANLAYAGNQPNFGRKISDSEVNDILNKAKQSPGLKDLKYQNIPFQKGFIKNVQAAVDPSTSYHYNPSDHSVHSGNNEFLLSHELGHAKDIGRHGTDRAAKAVLARTTIPEAALGVANASLIASRKLRNKIRNSGKVGNKAMDVFENHPWIPLTAQKIPTFAREAVADGHAIHYMYKRRGLKGGLEGAGLSALQLGAGYVAPMAANAALTGYAAKKIMNYQNQKEQEKQREKMRP